MLADSKAIPAALAALSSLAGSKVWESQGVCSLSVISLGHRGWAWVKGKASCLGDKTGDGPAWIAPLPPLGLDVLEILDVLADPYLPRDSQRMGAGLGGAQPGIAASCLGWLLAPDLEAQEILGGPGPQGHSLVGQRGLWTRSLWPNWQHHELALLASTRVGVGVGVLPLADEPWPPFSGCSEGAAGPLRGGSKLPLAHLNPAVRFGQAAR